jgi:hypothetical protein
MTIYRSNKTGRLTLLFLVSPMMYTGSWYEAVDYFTNEVNRKHVKLEDYTAVAYC